MTTLFAPPSSQSLLPSCLSASAERVLLSKRPLTFGTEKGVSEMKQSQCLNIQLQYMRSEPGTISPGHKSISPDLAASPLIACSYQIMQQKYDRDTWRMYKRIQLARGASQEQRISFIDYRVQVQSVNPNDLDDYCYDDDIGPLAEADNESEGIFEFDF